MDVPRLSTLQALMILLKARESAPKKGYYYRSWMSIVQAVQLGKDLGLHEHLADHEAGRSCDSDPAECALKTRIWQTLFVVELMIGSPQGMLASLTERKRTRKTHTGAPRSDGFCHRRGHGRL
jgi:hypothetical protein